MLPGLWLYFIACYPIINFYSRGGFEVWVRNSGCLKEILRADTYKVYRCDTYLITYYIINHNYNKILKFSKFGTNFVIHSYDYRSNWTPLSPNTIINREAVVELYWIQFLSLPREKTHIWGGEGTVAYTRLQRVVIISWRLGLIVSIEIRSKLILINRHDYSF